MKIKVYGGTREDRHLCLTCEHSMIIKGPTETQDLHLCTRQTAFQDGVTQPMEITFRVSDCNKYTEADNRNKEEMEQKAAYLIQLPSKKWVALAIGQLQDGYFMKELRERDRKESGTDYEKDTKKTVERVLKSGSGL